MNDDRNQPQYGIDELEAFEQQLRSLSPRDAAFQLPVANSHDLPVAALPAVDARSPGTKVWMATLIATWSMGAAAGVAGTLLYTRFGTATLRPQTAVISQELAIAIDESTQADAVNEKTFTTRVDPNEVGTPVNTAYREELQTGGTSENSYLFAPWSVLTEATGRSPLARQTLTPRSFGADLAFDTFRNGDLRLNDVARQSRKNQSGGPFKYPAVILPLPPEKLELPPPINQRDLLRNLLQI